MATQTIRVAAPLAAGSYTVNVQVDGSNTNAFTGRTLTAESVSGFWTFTVTSATAGLYAFQVLNGSSAVVAYGWFYSATDAAVTIQDSDSRDDALQTQRIGLPTGASLAADIAAGGGSGISQNDIDAIVAGLAESLTAPGFAASVAVQEGTYCTVADVEARLTAFGVDWLVDVVEVDGVRQSTETSLVTQAIDYCNTIIDTYIQEFVLNIASRPAGNVWLRDRCIDLACVRVFTLGGRDVPAVLQSEADKAMLWLQRAQNRDIQIPAFNYRSQILPVTHRKTGTPTVVRYGR